MNSIRRFVSGLDMLETWLHVRGGAGCRHKQGSGVPVRIRLPLDKCVRRPEVDMSQTPE